MQVRIKISQNDFNRLEELLLSDLPRETGAFALAGVATHGDSTDVIVRRIVPIPLEHYQVKEEYHLRIAPVAINGLIALCEANGLGAILCHSHPGEIDYSPSDDHGESRIVEALRPFIPASAPTASLLFTPSGVRARVWEARSATPSPLSQVVVMGRALRRIPVVERTVQREQPNPIYDRQVRAFGEEGQALIGQTKVGIVGVGGTGSPTAEQLVRLGVRDLVLVDPDTFEASNVTRVYGTFTPSARRRWWRRQTEQRKVELVAAHLRRINPEAYIRSFPLNVVVDSAARQLLDRDVLFLCTDDHWGRSIVNQIAHQHFIPTVNIGVRIAAEDGKITAARGVIDVLRPDLPCLWCNEFLRADRIAAESMPPNDRHQREQEGYVEGLGTREPSVVSVTTALSGMAVSLFVQLLTDFMGETGDVMRLNYDVLDGRVRRGQTTVKTKCLCKHVRGFGDLKPLSTLPDVRFLQEA